ncbi:MAG: energy transducer TonB [Lewinellaceae bacterium]|nr:energy transducer TonB [Lewinellaceae bacterium]
MKKIQFTLSALLFLALALPHQGSSQTSTPNSLSYEVNRIYPAIGVSEEKLATAQTLLDLNRHYQPSWVSTYLSVELSVSFAGKTWTATSKNDTLSAEQKHLLLKAEAGTPIAVKVLFIPENTLKNKESKETYFTFIVDPESEAKYAAGQQQLNQYLWDNAIRNIPAGRFQGFDLAAITFTIGEDGEIKNVQLFESSKDEATDALLLEAIRQMPRWEPATYANGTKVSQEFVLTVGNMENCLVNLLNIRQEGTR